MRSDFLQQQVLLEELFADPEGQRHAKRSKTNRGKSEVGFQQTFKLQERLVVKNDVIEVRCMNARFLETVLNRPVREARIVLLAREPLFLRSGHNLSVF